MKLVCPLGGAEGYDRGQMGSTKMEEQTLMAELAAVQIPKKDTIGKKKDLKGCRGKGDVVRV